jgi:hypothetical protein
MIFVISKLWNNDVVQYATGKRNFVHGGKIKGFHFFVKMKSFMLTGSA